MLTDKDQLFLKQRRWRVRTWPTVGTLMLIFLALLVLGLFWKTPLLINPLEVSHRVEADTLSRSMMILMAAILPNIVCGCFLLLLAMILFAFSTFTHERKYMNIIDRLLERHDSDRTATASEEKPE